MAGNCRVRPGPFENYLCGGPRFDRQCQTSAKVLVFVDGASQLKPVEKTEVRSLWIPKVQSVAFGFIDAIRSFALYAA